MHYLTILFLFVFSFLTPAQVVITGSGKALVSLDGFQGKPEDKNLLMKDLRQSGVVEIVPNSQARYRVEATSNQNTLQSRLTEMRQSQLWLLPPQTQS